MTEEDIKNLVSGFPTLPPSPVVYLSIMKTQKGKPVGLPLWTSFDDKSEVRSMENEAMSSTFLSLAKNVSDMTKDRGEEGKIVRISINNLTYNIYLPHPQDSFQLSFVIIFEHQDTILVKDKHKNELVRIVANTLGNIQDLRQFMARDDEEQIIKSNPLYNIILEEISENIKKWDKKRVHYLMEKRKEEELKKQQREIDQEEMGRQEN